jgi:bacterioferritin (cytochrome b1)
MADTPKQQLLAGLNEDLAHEYAAVILYRTYASAVTGPFRQELRTFFSNEIPDELGHAQLLADKIVALGRDADGTGGGRQEHRRPEGDAPERAR